ncbi:hypothetical protein AU106_gp079 [Sinorhizobium phage phiM9]|uniref:Uncharacterized protein n=1 Tax=Sinorhizobium phage phiM9 TaxID=1636182 RepID=A0A0F6R5U1_9CAUD|nr:hypothetical protein AU106_gp079 [Sinorhizobium phage phiM9]AKE44710.1 hypothetical protein Sm_phiM9_080 [Sinorhizobium phage phiM9]
MMRIKSKEEYKALLELHDYNQKLFKLHVENERWHLSEPLRKICNEQWDAIRRYEKTNGIQRYKRTTENPK